MQPLELPHEVSRADLLSRLRDPTLKVVNVLPLESFRAVRITGSLSLPVPEVKLRAAEVLPDRNADIVAYCGSFT